MAGFTPFTNNYSDLSDEHWYQFGFRCDICGSGYRNEFQRSALGTAGTLLSGASNLFGGIFSVASSPTNPVHNLAHPGARDEALKKAPTELMPNITQWSRDHV